MHVNWQLLFPLYLHLNSQSGVRVHREKAFRGLLQARVDDDLQGGVLVVELAERADVLAIHDHEHVDGHLWHGRAAGARGGQGRAVLAWVLGLLL